jgi:uncharacterized membrane protein
MRRDRRDFIQCCTVAAVAAALPRIAQAAGGDTADIAVRAAKAGETISVAVECPVTAPRAVVWDVLTDYDHMAKFISNLEQSVVRARMGDRVQVYQKGKASRGPLSFSFENVREIEMTPQTAIHSKMVSGDTMPASFVTRIDGAEPALRILHTGTYTPSIWVPPLVGPALIEAETRKQYGEIRDEILRRAGRRS